MVLCVFQLIAKAATRSSNIDEVRQREASGGCKNRRLYCGERKRDGSFSNGGFPSRLFTKQLGKTNCEEGQKKVENGITERFG
jgi:hypothetical protein